MEKNSINKIKKLIFVGLLLFLSGIAGLVYLFINTLPTLGPRWLFFFMLMIASTGLALPVVAFFHQRFPSAVSNGDNVIIRQSIWFGIYINGLAWLQLGRLLTSLFALFLAIGLIIIEFLIRLREQSKWQPEVTEDE